MKKSNANIFGNIFNSAHLFLLFIFLCFLLPSGYKAKMSEGLKRTYKFFGWEDADKVAPKAPGYENIKDLLCMYDIMTEVWCRETCAPRMRDDWTMQNMTLGQCSITSFLIQDIAHAAHGADDLRIRRIGIPAPVLLRVCLRFAGLLMILVKYSLVDKLLLSDAEPLSAAVQRIHQKAQYVKFSIFTSVFYHTDSHFIQGCRKRFQPLEKLE